jgi:glucose-6-phosphate 1-epimerase
MERLALQNQHGRVEFTPYGAQVLSYIPAAGQEVLWCLPEAALQAAHAAGKALRGGIPLCWPWFRQHDVQPTAPQHGLARIRPWQVLSLSPDTATLQLELTGQDVAFPYPARATLKIDLAATLTLTLTTTNLGEAPMPLTQALHSYLRVGHWQRGSLTGLEALPRWHLAHTQPLPAVAALHNLSTPPEDRFGPPLPGPLVWHDTLLNRRIVSVTAHATHAVVWHPGAVGAAALGIPPALTENFLCLEPAHLTGELLPPKQSLTLGLQLAATPLVASRR